MTTAVLISLHLVVLLCLLQGSVCGDDHNCPPWHFTPVNDSSLCSECGLPPTSDFYCSDTDGFIDIAIYMTANGSNYPLFTANIYFGLDRTKGLLPKSAIFRKVPEDISEFEGYFCGSDKRQGFLCGQCKPDCGIAIYTYYGLPCECPCYSYGIPLYILLEIGFSTLFFGLVIVLNFSANSSKWITTTLYFEIISNVISQDLSTYAILAKSGHWVSITIQTLCGIWNMDFLRLVIPRFCVSQRVSVLGAISTGYISAFWPLVLVVLTSLAMHLHKRNYKIVVYPWNLMKWLSFGLIPQIFGRINLIVTFATFFLLSYMKIVYVSILLITPTFIYVHSKDQQTLYYGLYSLDPHITYFNPNHLLYAVPAAIVLVLIGIPLPLILILYPTRCGTWFGVRVPSGRLRNAVKTFVEAMNGSYKDGSTGTRDYRALPGLLLLLRFALTAVVSSQRSGNVRRGSNFICVSLMFLGLAVFYGLCKPYKKVRHNLYDIVIYCFAAFQCFYFFTILSASTFKNSNFIIILSLIVVVLAFLKALLSNMIARVTRRL